ncbi:Uncharacterised protein [Serratia rubidaea]|uniref:Uncharacterized protein n=1 Tax=Serratia rubidaea TaxID=61652 RepID=A0A3S5DFA5_SERRU|nr:Uncharacterised protein [Serratia rubidaea]
MTCLSLLFFRPIFLPTGDGRRVDGWRVLTVLAYLEREDDAVVLRERAPDVALARPEQRSTRCSR